MTNHQLGGETSVSHQILAIGQGGRLVIARAENRMESNRADFSAVRRAAAASANQEDAAIWRWFSVLFEDRRIRWCLSGTQWLVSVDNKHVATAESFDAAIRSAKSNTESGKKFHQHGLRDDDTNDPL